jgi:DNA invertase Pin-like site-specific DNA recombinase
MAQRQLSRPRAYSYLRFSTPEQQKGDSHRRQTSLAREYAERHGLDLDEALTFHDLGVSAYRGANAETGRLADFRDAVRRQLVPRGSYLLVESLDRISRQKARKAMRALEDICDEGVKVVTLTDGRIYDREALDDDPTSLLMSLLIFIRANEESETKARRLRASWIAKRAKATTKALTSICPAWLKLDRPSGTFQVIKDRAAIVRQVFRLTLEGMGQHAIAEKLNRERVPVFGRGRHWHRSYVVKLLASPAVIGTMVPHQIEYADGKRRRRKPLDPIPGYFPAVVDEDAYQRVQTLRRDVKSPRRGRHANGKVSNLFGGLVRCPWCSSSMTLSNKGSGWRYLVCTKAKAGAGCEYKAIRYDDVEQAFMEDWQHLLGTYPADTEQGGELDEKLDQLETGISATEDEIARLLDAVQKGRERRLAVSTVTDRLAGLEADLAQMQAERDDLLKQRQALSPTMVTHRVTDLETMLNERGMDRAAVNVLLRQLFNGIVVDHASGRLVFQWRHGGESTVTYGWPTG